MTKQGRVLGRVLAQELSAHELGAMANSAGGLVPGSGGTSRRIGTSYAGSPGTWDDGVQSDGNAGGDLGWPMG